MLHTRLPGAGLKATVHHLSFSIESETFILTASAQRPTCQGSFAIRTVVVPHPAESPLLRALLDVRSAVNHLLPDWRAHPEESRFDATKRSYRLLRERYPHLASGWCVTIANETIAVLNAWDRSLRRAKAVDPERFRRMQSQLPHRRRLKASLHPNLFRWKEGRLTITLHATRHLEIDLRDTRHPLFVRYGEASRWRFGLTVTDSALLFHFRVPHEIADAPETAGIDLNFGSAVYATSEGKSGSVDLTPILAVQHRMAQKRQSIARQISKDLRHQRAVLRRYGRRERHRVEPLLHGAANQLLREVGPCSLAFENLTDVTAHRLQSEHRSPESRRRLSRWAHGRLARIVQYKARTPTVEVNPWGTSQECPGCGGPTAVPSGEGAGRRKKMPRSTVCGACGGIWDRDAAAAIAVLARGRRLLRGAAVPPSARDALLKAARWRSTDASRSGLTGEPRKEDDARFGIPAFGQVSG